MYNNPLMPRPEENQFMPQGMQMPQYDPRVSAGQAFPQPHSLDLTQTGIPSMGDMMGIPSFGERMQGFGNAMAQMPQPEMPNVRGGAEVDMSGVSDLIKTMKRFMTRLGKTEMQLVDKGSVERVQKSVQKKMSSIKKNKDVQERGSGMYQFAKQNPKHVDPAIDAKHQREIERKASKGIALVIPQDNKMESYNRFLKNKKGATR